MLADLCPNVYFDTSSTNSWVKYHAPSMEVRDAFRKSLDLLGPRRLLFGTDSSFFPRGWHRAIFDAQVNLLFDLGVSADEAELIFGANLRRILAQAEKNRVGEPTFNWTVMFRISRVFSGKRRAPIVSNLSLPDSPCPPIAIFRPISLRTRIAAGRCVDYRRSH